MKETIELIGNLPIDQRIKIADALLKTVNKPDPNVEKAWAEEVQQRLKECEERKSE